MVRWLGCLDRPEEVWLLMELMDQDLHSLLVSKRARCMRHAERYSCTLHNPVGTIRCCRANKQTHTANQSATNETKRNTTSELHDASIAAVFRRADKAEGPLRSARWTDFSSL